MIKKNKVDIFNKLNIGFSKFVILFFVVCILFVVFILAAPSFHTTKTTSYLTEEQTPIFEYNFSSNVTNTQNDTLIYSIKEINSNLYPNQNESSFYYWINITSDTGILNINSQHDNETGRFNISVEVVNEPPDSEGMISVFYFISNATNDAPNFTTVVYEYNLSAGNVFSEYVNGSDEEKHYPLNLTINFFTNCTHASWSDRTNCTLFSLINISDTSALMNFTPTSNDVGVYWANISVIDYVSNCSSDYCVANYSENRTIYSEILTFNVFSSLSINVSDCQNKIFQENVSDTCIVNITTKGQEDSLNISSIADIRNYDGSVLNTSWFFGVNQTVSKNFSKGVTINVTAGKTEIGNWTINFTIQDLNSGENVTEQIYVYVNRTYNDLPEINSIANQNTSINFLMRINLTVHDEDMLIPDKMEGYNETINFTLQILNQSDLTQELNISDFEIEVLSAPVSGTNRTEAKIEFTPNSNDTGDYTINVSLVDKENAYTYTLFNLSILDNSAPVWNDSMSTVFKIYEDSEIYLNFSKNVSDADGDDLTFSFTNDTSFPNFTMGSTTGVINLTPADVDIGQHLVEITVSDGYLTDLKVFNFTIYNVNDDLVIEKLQSINATPSTITEGIQVNVTEDNYTTLTLWVQDEDIKVPLGQKSFYNESFTINLTIEGNNINLFNFSKTSDFPTSGALNRTEYEAIFTPNKTDVGDYNITINITDESNSSTSLSFNLTILELEHNPILDDLINQTTKINQSFYYNINATDEEDGADSEGSLTFSYDFLSGRDFINNNESIFNTTFGILNITFNSSQGGRYHMNITVNDSGGSEDSDDFWINVYDVPVIGFPSSNYNFSLTENITSNLTFQANHSVQDNLTYLFYIDSINYIITDTGNTTYGNFTYGNLSLRKNQVYYGNMTNLTWSFAPNFTDEGYGLNKNITLIVFNSLYPELNASQNWNLNISHTNAPITFETNIGKQSRDYNTDITINLAGYFNDYDFLDSYINQTFNFSISSDTSPSYIAPYATVSSDWVLTLSAPLRAINEFLIINATDLDDNNLSLTSALSNAFEVEFTTPSTTLTPVPTSGGGSSPVPYAFKLIVPGQISAFAYEKIEIPIRLENKGKKAFNFIDLHSSAFKDGDIFNQLDTSFDNDYFPVLRVGKSENITLTLFFKTDEAGTYEVLLNATSKSPKYNDWAKIYIDLQVINDSKVEEILLFTEEFIVQNPECLELTELLDEAKSLFEKGKNYESIAKSEEIVGLCKEFVSQTSLPSYSQSRGEKVRDYVSITVLGSFLFGIIYYYISRRRIKKAVKFPN